MRRHTGRSRHSYIQTTYCVPVYYQSHCMNEICDPVSGWSSFTITGGVLVTIFVWAMFHSRAESRRKESEHRETAELTKDNEKLVEMKKYSQFANTLKECALTIGAFALVVAIIFMALNH